MCTHVLVQKRREKDNLPRREFTLRGPIHWLGRKRVPLISCVLHVVSLSRLTSAIRSRITQYPYARLVPPKIPIRTGTNQQAKPGNSGTGTPLAIVVVPFVRRGLRALDNQIQITFSLCIFTIRAVILAWGTNV